MANSAHWSTSGAARVLRIALIPLAWLTLPAAPETTIADLHAPQDPSEPRRAEHPALVVFRQNTDASIEVLRDGTDAQPGDLVQAAYFAAGNLHGVIVSFDGDGVVTLHHPNAPDEPTQLQPRGMTPLPHSFELDAARDFERFVFVSSRDHDIDVSEVLQAATRVAGMGPIARGRALPLPESWVQTSFVLGKPSR